VSLVLALMLSTSGVGVVKICAPLLRHCTHLTALFTAAAACRALAMPVPLHATLPSWPVALLLSLSAAIHAALHAASDSSCAT
jgi:hypothetical protein